MAKLVGQPPVVELKCGANPDGTYNAGIWLDGVQQLNDIYTVLNGDCEAIRELWKRARDAWGVNPAVLGPCVDCFPQDFLDAEAL